MSNKYEAQHAQPEKKNGKKKWIIGGIAALLLIGGCNAATGTNTAQDAPESTTATRQAEPMESFTEATAEPVQVEETTVEAPEVPRAHENALRSAQNYIDMMPMSATDLQSQLEFEGYTTDQAQQAVAATY